MLAACVSVCFFLVKTFVFSDPSWCNSYSSYSFPWHTCVDPWHQCRLDEFGRKRHAASCGMSPLFRFLCWTVAENDFMFRFRIDTLPSTFSSRSQTWWCVRRTSNLSTSSTQTEYVRSSYVSSSCQVIRTEQHERNVASWNEADAGLIERTKAELSNCPIKKQETPPTNITVGTKFRRSKRYVVVVFVPCICSWFQNTSTSTLLSPLLAFVVLCWRFYCLHLEFSVETFESKKVQEEEEEDSEKERERGLEDKRSSFRSFAPLVQSYYTSTKASSHLSPRLLLLKG